MGRVPGHIEIVQGDITRLGVDAIVNAANGALAPGGGVCGAIHAAAGPGLARECASLGHCPTGEARLTGGHVLPARFVVHAVGPVWRGGAEGEDDLLARAYRSALDAAAAAGARSIAFPAISTGIYGFPLERATRIAVREARAGLDRHPSIERVVLCCFSARDREVHEREVAGPAGA
ncbi:MAG TPA: macro domain-containing protein [Anaeromyxobacteraceae bacterium]|nr:macro domain-containing protein [Anaeromyxobacteraceae bacterium]